MNHPSATPPPAAPRLGRRRGEAEAKREYSLAHVAAIAGIALGDARNAAAAGTLATVARDGERRCTPDALVAFLDARAGRLLDGRERREQPEGEGGR